MKAIATHTVSNNAPIAKKHGSSESALKAVRSLISPLDNITSERPTGCACGGGCPRCQSHPVIQPKLRVSTPGDRYEQEADRVADEVMRTAEPHAGTILGATASGPVLQRKCAACESASQERPAEELEGTLQAKEVGGRTLEPDGNVWAEFSPLRGGGEPLPMSARAYFEPRFGQDFAQVRVHRDAQAAASARGVSAQAYTVGRDIVFGEGAYAPDTEGGKKLLAHELTHVVQQRESRQAAARAPTVDHGARRTESYQHTNPQLLRPGALAGRPLLQRQQPPQTAPTSPPQTVPAASPRVLTSEETQSAVSFNQGRFQVHYVIQVIREVIGLPREPAVIDEAFVGAVVAWQNRQRMAQTDQDGKIGHNTTRTLVLRLIELDRLRDAILLTMDAYNLLSLAGSAGSRDLSYITVDTQWPAAQRAAKCCGADGTVDGRTLGGAGAPPGQEGNLSLCFCSSNMIAKARSDYIHFVRIIGHELVHIPHHTAGSRNEDVYEFEAYFWEVCGGPLVPHLSTATLRVRNRTTGAIEETNQRRQHIGYALDHWARIPETMRTPERIRMEAQLRDLDSRGGVGAC